MRSGLRASLWLAACGLTLAQTLLAQMSLSLTPSVPSPAPLGTLVTWTATPSGASPGTLRYRFRVRNSSGGFRTIVDYGPNASLDWSTIDHEGGYEIEASVMNNQTGETAGASQVFVFTALATEAPVLTPTANTLVFIYSAPPCGMGESMRVEFQSSEGFVQRTPSKACASGFSMNFYIAGLRGGTTYNVHHILETAKGPWDGPRLSITTLPVPIAAPGVSMMTADAPPSGNGILLQSRIGGPPIATDLNGNIVWYGPGDILFLTRPHAGGTFLGITEVEADDPSQQFFREFDLAGVRVAETNGERVNQQLALMGFHPMTSFHHEARKLADGSYLVMAASERVLTGVQGPGDVHVLGDIILVLDANLNVTWAWDAFDHLDPYRKALLNESCTHPAVPGCAMWSAGVVANDWLHGNALQLTSDGNILYSARHQDWLIKIDYRNGAGTGAILWRLGKDGDFGISSPDAYPWFSHQHDGNIDATGILMVFDNGNTRAQNDPSAHSRGQVYVLDEPNRKALPLLNADLGVYSGAVGSAQKLPDGSYHFEAGFIQDPVTGGFSAQSLELSPQGDLVYGIQTQGVEYRSFRLPDLYADAAAPVSPRVPLLSATARSR
jgi:arylsulfate sulfotransferase